MKWFVLNGPYCDDNTEFDFDPGDWTRVGQAPKCELCGNFVGMLALLPPIKGRLEFSRTIFDLSVTSGADVLLSERCLRAFEENRIHGLVDIHPVELLGIDGPATPQSVGKFFLAGVRAGAEVDRVRSGLRTSNSAVCPACGNAGLIHGYDRVAIRDGSWTGWDLFSLRGLPGIILVTESLRNLCCTLSLAVCGFIPAEEKKMHSARSIQ